MSRAASRASTRASSRASARATERASSLAGSRLSSPSGRDDLARRLGEFGLSRGPWVLWAVLTAVGAASLAPALVPVGPDWLAPTGSVVVATAFAGALASRTGGRPLLFAALALLCGVVATRSGSAVLLSGASVATAALASTLAVMLTVPAASVRAAARECVLALAIAVLGSLAAIGFGPSIDPDRYEFVGLGLAFLAAVVLVYRLGAGFHGLGRRGLITVAVGAALMTATLLYAELLRRYGSAGLVDELLAFADWMRERLGAFPRPLVLLLGVPALAYGCHMRARRRQGWWVLAFGVAATSPTATALANPAITLHEALLSMLYGLLGGLVIGWVLIRLDLALTGNRGRRSRSAEEAAAVRPEPPRFSALL